MFLQPAALMLIPNLTPPESISQINVEEEEAAGLVMMHKLVVTRTRDSFHFLKFCKFFLSMKMTRK